MYTKLKEAVKEGEEMAKRMNEVVKNIKPSDTSKIVLSSKPYGNKDDVFSR